MSPIAWLGGFEVPLYNIEYLDNMASVSSS